MFLLFKVFLIISLLRLLSSSSYNRTICGSNTTIYARNSTYHSNLNRLLSSLSSNANRTTNYGFYNATAGFSAPDVAYGLYMCRGDVTADVCRDCMGTVTTEITRRCPEEREAVIWYDECILRYSNQSFVTTLDETPGRYSWDTGIVSEPARFQQVMGETMMGLANLASNDDPNDQFVRGFGTREANFTSLQTLYGMVQCTPDLSGTDCNRCLRGAIGQLSSCCAGREGVRVFGRSCRIRYEMYPFYRILAAPAPSPTPVLPPPPPPTSVSAAAGNNNIVIIIVVATVTFAILVVCIFIFIRRKRNSGKATKLPDVETLRFNFNTIRVATNYFSDSNKLGVGGFGAVYKGRLQNCQEIAVKRLSENSKQGELEFENEVLLLAKLQHRNLVRFIGFCHEKIERLLIYEFVPNSSLDRFIFDPVKRATLYWDTRYKIISGVARGLLYLHEDSRLRIIHRDLKPSNVLLDAEMNPKIADFGLAKLFEVDQTHGNTSKIAGSYGYMAPEYLRGQLSLKSDVYSFGVVLLEIISGQKNTSFQMDDEENAMGLLSYAWKNWREGTTSNLIDPAIKAGSDPLLYITRCIHIGLLCVQESPGDRPTMASVINMLNSISLTLPPPLEPGQQKTTSVKFSINEVSITELSGR